MSQLEPKTIKPNPKREAFFEKAGKKEFYFLGAFRNTYGELFCLYQHLDADLRAVAPVYMIGDETGWEEDDMRSFMFSYPEQDVIRALMKSAI